MFFVYKKLTLGGAETLILRIVQELQKEEPCSVLCSSISQEAKEMFDKRNVIVNILPKWDEKVLAHTIQSKKAMFYNPTDFILVSNALQSKGILSNCFLYVVHYNCVSIQSKSLTFLNKRLNRDAKIAFYELEKSGRILFMDDMCANYYRRLYGYTKDKTLKILHLPLVEPKVLHQRLREDKVINILSVARADFPFKGYLLGLIKEIQSSIFSTNICLTIISYGEGYQQLKELSEKPTENNNISIRILEKIDYDQLNSYYQNNDLYIGMGTTIIEAASNGCISIPVLPYTYDVVIDNFFYENPQRIALEEGSDISVIELINRYINASDEEKLKMKKKSYQAFKENYSMSGFLKTISNLQFEQEEFKISKITKAMLKLRMIN